MPSPFDSREGSSRKAEAPLGQNEVPVEGSSLVCEHCFEYSSNGLYNTETKTLSWNCFFCGVENVVRNVEA